TRPGRHRPIRMHRKVDVQLLIVGIEASGSVVAPGHFPTRIGHDHLHVVVRRQAGESSQVTATETDPPHLRGQPLGLANHDWAATRFVANAVNFVNHSYPVAEREAVGPLWPRRAYDTNSDAERVSRSELLPQNRRE